jgi:hypothetical protein
LRLAEMFGLRSEAEVKATFTPQEVITWSAELSLRVDDEKAAMEKARQEAKKGRR